MVCATADIGLKLQFASRIRYTEAVKEHSDALRIVCGLLIVALAASCSALHQLTGISASPATGYRYLELLRKDSFDKDADWRSYDGGAELFMDVKDGEYLIDFLGRQYVWTQTEAHYADIVIEAEVTQQSDYGHNAFGLGCRLDSGNRGRGYYFLISGDGYASIRWSDGRSLTPIVAAAPTNAVMKGRSKNRLRVVCIDDVLALWVNDELVAEARDQRASKGAAGMVGVMNYEGRRLTVAFDNLKVWRAVLDERPR